jgi:hypothetical protein
MENAYDRVLLGSIGDDQQVLWALNTWALIGRGFYALTFGMMQAM